MSSGIDPIHVENAAKARALYTDNLQPEESRQDWHIVVRAARKRVAIALRASSYLQDIPGALELDCGHGLVFRYLLAPPVSQDQFKLLCDAWPKSAEKAGKPISRKAADAAASVIISRLDPGLVRWPRGERPPTRREVTALLTVVPALIAQQQLATARRGRTSVDQEEAVTALLKSENWAKLPSKLIDQRGFVPPRHFMRKTRFATGPTAHQEVDIACGLDASYVLAMECKVSNDETNSVKRINDVLKKATAWKNHWGNFVITAAMLQGVIAAKDVQRLVDMNVLVFWSHDLPTFRNWLSTRVGSSPES